MGSFGFIFDIRLYGCCRIIFYFFRSFSSSLSSFIPLKCYGHLERNLRNHLLLNVKMSVAVGWSCSNIITYECSMQLFCCRTPSPVILWLLHNYKNRCQCVRRASRVSHKDTIICWCVCLFFTIAGGAVESWHINIHITQYKPTNRGNSTATR